MEHARLTTVSIVSFAITIIIPAPNAYLPISYSIMAVLPAVLTATTETIPLGNVFHVLKIVYCANRPIHACSASVVTSSSMEVLVRMQDLLNLEYWEICLALPRISLG